MKFKRYIFIFLLFSGIHTLPLQAKTQKKIAIVTGENNPDTSYKSIFSGIIHLVHFKSPDINFQVFHKPDKLEFNQKKLKLFFQTIEFYAPDIILAFGTRNLEVLSGHFHNVPIIFSMVYRTDLVDAIVAKNDNICGLYISLNMDKPLQMLKEIKPDIESISIIYSKGYFGNLTRDFSVLAEKEHSIKVTSHEIHTQIDLKGKDMTRLFKKADAFFFLPDPYLLDNSVIKKIMLLSEKFNVLVFCDYANLVKKGALIGFVLDKKEIIHRTENLLWQHIIETQVICQKISNCETFSIYYNKTSAQLLDIRLPEKISLEARGMEQ